jgi:hypothetical protein
MPKAIKKSGITVGDRLGRRLKMTLDEINVMGNLLNTTFGRSSTTAAPTESVTGNMDGELVVLKYVTIMTLYDRASHRELVNNQCEVAKKTIKSKCRDLERAFNKHFRGNMKLKEVECTHMVDPVAFRPNGIPSQTIFRMTVFCEMK